MFGIHENEEATVALQTPGAALYDARTGEIHLEPAARAATSVAGSRPTSIRAIPATNCGPTRRSGLLDVHGKRIADAPPSVNFAVWWDGDLLRELLDRNRIGKWDWTAGTLDRLLTADGAVANNGTKATPALSADILGDWREEVIWRSADNDVAANLHDDDSAAEPSLHADARSAVPVWHRVAKRRLQPAAASRLLPRRRHEAAAASAHQRARTTGEVIAGEFCPTGAQDSARRPRPSTIATAIVADLARGFAGTRVASFFGHTKGMSWRT